MGSALLANATMETFDQSPNPLATPPPNNCFSCHNTSAKNPQPVHVTHSITNAADLRSCPWTTPPPSLPGNAAQKSDSADLGDPAGGFALIAAPCKVLSPPETTQV